MTKPAKKINGPFPKQKDEAYVACLAEPGMFRDEFLVIIEGVNPARPNEPIKVQVLVDADLVRSISGVPARGKPVSARLRVGVVRISKGVATVVLPQPGIPVGESMLVKEDSLART